MSCTQRHFKALKHAGLVVDKIPTLEEALSMIKNAKTDKEKIKAKEESDRNRRRSTFFCVGYSEIWDKPIHHTIRELKKDFGLGWLRVSMSYHRFTNLREIFQGDLSGKLIEGVESRDYQILECNCRLPGGKCGYNNVCLDSMVIYQVECLVTGKFYIGNTQQSVKDRMKGHFHDVQMLIAGKQKRSDSYAKHFAAQFTDLAEGEVPSPAQQREKILVTVLWRGNPISMSKTFGTRKCVLCDKERLEIFKRSIEKPDSLINICDEIYGACRHNPMFHWYVNQPPSTDDSTRMKKSRQKKKKPQRQPRVQVDI